MSSYKGYRSYKTYRTYLSYIAITFIVSCAEPEEAPLLPIEFKLHQTEAQVLAQLDSAGYKPREHIPNKQLGDSIPVAGLPGITTYFFHPDGIWHGIFFSHTDSTFKSWQVLRTRMEQMYGNAEELNQQPQTKQGYAVWRPGSGRVRFVRLAANRGELQLFIADTAALSAMLGE